MDCNFSKPWEIRVGDVLDKLREMPDESIHCVVTSPPYFGLRDYGVEGQLGLEATPADYVDKMVTTFREIRRVLRSDGTLWLNLGDSYAGGGYANHKINGPDWFAAATLDKRSDRQQKLKKACASVGIKPKDMVGIPWRVAFALQADGWYLRSDIIWHKPNPMPESVTDRPTKAHEYLFLLTRSPKYFYDAEAIKVPCSPKTFTVHTTPTKGTGKESTGEKLNLWMRDNGGRYNPLTANKRSVWPVSSRPFKEAHFATFPPKLIEPCILAGTSAFGCCVSCNAPWKRILKRTAMVVDRSDRTHALGRTRSSGTMLEPPTSKTIGWNPSCDCVPNAPIPATVLDPFSGAATTLLVATQHGRNSIGIELNPEYAAMAERRLLAPPKTKKTARKKPTVLASNPLPLLESLSVSSLFLN